MMGMKKITTNSKNGGADVQGGNGEALPDIERSVQAMMTVHLGCR